MVGGQQPPQQWQQNLYPPHSLPKRYKPERPAGVLVIAILMLIGAILLLFMGFGMFAVAFLASGGPEFGDVLGVLLGLAGLIILLIGIAYIILALGLLKLKAWARRVARALAAVGIVLGLIALADGDVTSIVGLVINFIIFFYLGSRYVKAAFEGARLAIYQSPRIY